MDILKELDGARKIGISGHVRPDGDCVGSCLAMYGYLRKAMPDCELTLFLEPPSEVFSFLKYYDRIDNSFVGINDFDAYIALDAGDSERLGKAEPFFKRAKKTLCIDHHVSNPGYGDISLIEPDSSSTCEMLYRLFEKKYVDDDIATALYTGIVHDTGVFQYSNTRKATFDVVGDLVEYDFDCSKIIDDTFYKKSYVQNQILGRVLTESILFMDGRCIAGCVTRKMMNFYEARATDLEGIVNQLRVTEGVEVAIFMHELRSQEYKVSMRSNGKVDVSLIALYFGGGGHVRAAGCMMNGSYYDVINNLSLHIEKQLEEFEKNPVIKR